jgi:hypothetical protein
MKKVLKKSRDPWGKALPGSDYHRDGKEEPPEVQGRLWTDTRKLLQPEH